MIFGFYFYWVFIVILLFVKNCMQEAESLSYLNCKPRGKININNGLTFGLIIWAMIALFYFYSIYTLNWNPRYFKKNLISLIFYYFKATNSVWK